MSKSKKQAWFKVLDDSAELAEGRVRTVTAQHKDLCLVHFEGKFCAMDNKCPHQGGPLGEGSIENGLLRCPWHGWDYHPCTGKAPGYDDGVETFPTEIREGAVYVQMEVEEKHESTITDLMAETMTNWGVEVVFGMVGHSNLGLADALRRQEEKGNLRYFGIRHEGAASFAASAYGKLLGKPAACFSIAGPGATNLYTGLWDAKVDRAPLLALTGQVATQVLGTGNFQELDLVQAFDSVAAFNHRVDHGSKHTELMSLAIKHALIKREVAHLTFPDEIQEMPAPQGLEAQTPEGRMADFRISPSQDSLDSALNILKNSKRPLIISGHGARFDMPAIIELAEKLKCPVVTTFKGKGQISDAHPNAGGVLGRSGTPIASWFMNECDAILVFGASFSKHTGITDKKPTIQIDFDPMALAKFHKVDVPLWGEISQTVGLLQNSLNDVSHTTDQVPEIAGRWKIWREEKQRRMKEYREQGLGAIHVFDAMNQYAPETAVMCVDVGNNAYSFGRYYESKQNNFLMSGYLGSIGFALPASMGAWAAVGDKRPIIAVAGDGGLGQYLADFTTLVKYNMSVKLIVINNSELGKISKEQRAGDFDVWKTKLTNPVFADYAVSCGAWGKRISKPEEIGEAMQELFAQEGPGLLEVMSDVSLI
ncbi:MAG: thiamine pyrophosphate-binding protein [Bacteroidia bacterium]|nr:thiamine pyrophosphate-binding protein [Bacteroidia bacterium]